MIINSRLVKQAVLNAFKADTLEEANKHLEKMDAARRSCDWFHWKAQENGLYKSYTEAYKIHKAIVDMGYYSMHLKGLFKRKFHPSKAHIRLSKRDFIIRVIGIPVRPSSIFKGNTYWH